MVNKYVEDFFARLFSERYARYWYWKAEITQIMWTALYEARDRYRRYAGAYELEKYAEKVIVYHVDRWISDNKHHQLACFSLNQKIVDNTSEMIELLVYDEPFCSLELFDFLSQLSRIKYLICKAYIFYYEDEDIASLLCISKDRLDEIKRELQDDFREGYLL